jgi:large subunit ribosomal protein L19
LDFKNVGGFKMNITDVLEIKINPNIPALAPGDTVRVRQKVTEGEKTRIQVFQGVIIKIHHAAAGTNFTVRRVTSGVGVERTFPVYSPMIDGVEVVRHGKVRRAKLYYLRGLSSRASRIKEKRIEKLGEEVRPPEPVAEQTDTATPEAAQAGQPPAPAPETAAPAPGPTTIASKEVPSTELPAVAAIETPKQKQ